MSVGQSVWKVYCGKTAEWIRMPFVWDGQWIQSVDVREVTGSMPVFSTN